MTSSNRRAMVWPTPTVAPSSGASAPLVTVSGAKVVKVSERVRSPAAAVRVYVVE